MWVSGLSLPVLLHWGIVCEVWPLMCNHDRNVAVIVCRGAFRDGEACALPTVRSAFLGTHQFTDSPIGLAVC